MERNCLSLFEEMAYTHTGGPELESLPLAGLYYDSRRVEAGGIFVCLRGMAFDGHEAVPEALERGAAVLVYSEEAGRMEERLAGLPGAGGVCRIRVEDGREALARLSAAYFGHPARRLLTIGVTGTKGKTTTTYMIKALLEALGLRMGLIGTIESCIGGQSLPAANTTPESYILQQTMARMVEAGMDGVVMEVSSQALMMRRSDGFVLDLGIFTNLEPDHIGAGEHESFAHYLECKRRLFTMCRLGLVNVDDGHWQEVVQGHSCRLHSFGLGAGAEYRAEDVKLSWEGGLPGVSFGLAGEEGRWHLGLPGRFNVYNALAALAALRLLQGEGRLPAGGTAQALGRALWGLRVKGRTEAVEVGGGAICLIDYAHNAMALESLLRTLREYGPGRLVCLFGCGGNRARDRRCQMGEVAGRLADWSILTSDNPRWEDPLAILADIRAGIEPTGGAFVEIADRKEAIAYALDHARPGDMVLLCGKGHEDYQEIQGVKYPMDEREILAAYLASRQA